MKSCVCTFFLTFGMLLPSAAVAADDADGIVYDLWLADSSLTVSLDLARYLTSGTVRKMREGVDQAIEYDIRLTRPKRLWGSETIANYRGCVQISRRVVTGLYVVAFCIPEDQTERRYPSLAGLHRFLTDSIIVKLSPPKGLDTLGKHELRISVKCLSVSSFNPSPIDSSGTGAVTPIRYFFEQFLILTGFGREEYSTRTRPFRPAELPRRPTR